MTYFNRGGDSRGGQSFGRRDSFSRSDRPEMFDAVCAQCGSNCQVPFKPNGRKEVFCSKCFETNGGGSSRDSFRDSRDSRDSVGTYFKDKPMFNAVCDECGENCKIPFEPRNGKPVLCSNCFAKSRGSSYPEAPHSSYSRPAMTPTRDNGSDLEVINAKLDKILRLLTPKEVVTVEKEMTAKILGEIEANTGKKASSSKGGLSTKKVLKKKTVSKE